MHRVTKLAVLCCLLSAASIFFSSKAAQRSEGAELVEVRKIWDRAPHNAFTDLVRFKDQWYCVFREALAHVSPDGVLRIITSSDGSAWTSAAVLSSSVADLGDPTFSVTPDGRLMVHGDVALYRFWGFRYQTFAWFSSDGRNWSEPIKVGEPDVWLWRITWWRGIGYGIGYSTVTQKFLRLYTSRDGVKFETLVANLFDEHYPNESSLLFLDNDTALCLVRRDGILTTAQLGSARPPYRAWSWKDLKVTVGSPNMIRLPDGRIVAAVRFYNRLRTSLCWVDVEAGRLSEFLVLPSGGVDTGYAGMVFHNGLLWVSYYSQHEGKTSVYLAKVRFPPAN